MTKKPIYTRWPDVPAHLKTKTALGRWGLRLARGQQPVALKTGVRSL